MTQNFTPHHLSVYYPDSVDHLIKHNPYKVSIKVFLLHSKTKELNNIIAKLSATFSPIFLIRVDDPEKMIKGHEEISITSPHDFLKKLTGRKDEIGKVLLASFPKKQIEFVVDLPLTENHHFYNPENSFKASKSNFMTLNQILGNIWANDKPRGSATSAVQDSKVNLAKPPEDSSRFKILVDQLEKMNDLEIMVLKDRKVQFPNGRYEWLSPLILIVPFNFPSLGKVYGPGMNRKELKQLQKALNHEQALNYNSYVKTEETTVEELRYRAKFQNLKIQYLDSVGYLHASFTYSPVIRFPMLGNSIKTELSFFKPETINETKWLKSKELIDKFGQKLSSLIIPKGLEDKVLGLPRQVVAITDLPVEWLIYKQHNLCFTHDVTRIPETPYGGIMASYAVSTNVQFEIKEDVLSRTLVLLGSSDHDNEDEDFKKYFESIEQQSKTLGFKTFRCQSIQDVKDQISLHRPDFLIFDCHGGFNPETLSSHLDINGQSLTADAIARDKLVAPLVFLSACHTNPNYGYLNKLADAFFEVGCISITATYFPISILSGSNIYFRLLKNLSNAAKAPVHKNWLEFVSHVVRTSYYKDVVYATMRNVESSETNEKDKGKILRTLHKLNIRIGVNMLRADRRIEIMKEFEEELKNICPKDLIDTKTISEFVFYTHMGRGDLVRFESWNKEFERINGLKFDRVLNKI